ncbi:uncharacterized protein LOC127867996 [Dreissena polymorpha]|uniref:Uncharacterized protein n=1 Tax=Dreissena polymorpha TaxID=45954 RepID=A0A9D4M6P7_DREPO|nr:uncharacterized protein LOC127867996 [Dreissena polymorpha]KAH3869336.1 hypothetical protein DPMN_032499 [Dreissena polymorpha]
MRYRKSIALRHAPIVVFIALELLMWEVDAQRRPRVRNSPRLGARLPEHLQSAYLSAVNSNANGQSVNPDVTTQAPQGGQGGGGGGSGPEFQLGLAGREWSSLAPTVPAAADIECMVEVQVTQIRGGRCTRLAGRHRPYICQSGQHFSFAPHCEARMNQRAARTQEAEPEG